MSGTPSPPPPSPVAGSFLARERANAVAGASRIAYEREEDEKLAKKIAAKLAGIDLAASTLAGGSVTPHSVEPIGSNLSDLLMQREYHQLTDELETQITLSSIGPGGFDVPWDEATGDFIKASPAFMAQELLSGPSEPPYRGRFLVSEHHEEWDALATTKDRLCVLAPRDHSKTFFFDFAIPIWKIITQPNGIGFIFSATQTQAERILDDIKRELESNPKLRWLVPKSKAGQRWGGGAIRLANGHRIYARGFGTKVRGAHPTWIVVDDGLNDETAYSEVVRKKQIEYFYTAITNMIVPGGQIIVVGTPFHQSDLYGDLEKNKSYTFRRYQAIKPDGTALWPDRYNVKKLQAKRAEIGTIRFTREFQCEPIGDDMSLFPGHLFRGEPIEQHTLKLGMPARFWDKLGITRYMGVDFALSSSVQADYTVIWTMGVDKYGNRWIVDIQREKGLAYDQQQSLIKTAAKKYKPALIFLEANQMQRIFGDELIRKTDLPIKKFITGKEKNSLEDGVPSLRILLENKKFRIPRGDPESIEATDTWVNEMRAFTWTDGKLQGVGEHDDTVMACWICDQAIKQGGFSVSFGNEKTDPDDDESLEDYWGLTEEKAKGKKASGKLGEDEEAEGEEGDEEIDEGMFGT